MGFIRGSLLVLISALLFISLIGVNSLFIVSSSLSYENVNHQIKSAVYEGGILGDWVPTENLFEGLGVSNSKGFNLTQNQENQIKDYLDEQCQNKTEYVFIYGDYTVNIPCKEAQEGGSQVIINETIDDLLEGVYYDNYNCDYWDCFTNQNTPLFLISKKSYDYWKSKTLLMFFVSLVLVVLTFFLVKEKKNFPILLGALLIISALPLLGIESFILSLFGKFSNFFTSILTNVHLMFWISFILGLVMIGLGIAWKVWDWKGFKKLEEKFSKK